MTLIPDDNSLSSDQNTNKLLETPNLLYNRQKLYQLS